VLIYFTIPFQIIDLFFFVSFTFKD